MNESAKGIGMQEPEALTDEPLNELGITPYWQMSLNEEAAELLKNTIGSDDCVSPITLSLCDGADGYGLYAWLTEYPEEGALLIAAAPKAVPAADVQFTPQEQAHGWAMRGGTRVYCCYGMYADVGRDQSCRYATPRGNRDE